MAVRKFGMNSLANIYSAPVSVYSVEGARTRRGELEEKESGRFWLNGSDNPRVAFYARHFCCGGKSNAKNYHGAAISFTKDALTEPNVWALA